MVRVAFGTLVNLFSCSLGCIKLLSKKVRFSYLLQQNVKKWTLAANS